MKRREFLNQSTCAIALGISLIIWTNANEKNLGAMPDYRSTGVKLPTNSTPAADGFRFPAEWDEHEYTIMLMPPPQNWQGTWRRRWRNPRNHSASTQVVASLRETHSKVLPA